MKRRRRKMKVLAAVKVGVLVALTAFGTFSANVCLANPTTYTGSLSVGVGGGLIATGGWDNPSTTLSWVVDDTIPGKWHYSYTLTVPGGSGGISHIIIEASDGDPWEEFTIDNLFDPSSDPDGWIGLTEIHEHSKDGGNPNMPDDMWGIKFNANVGFDYTTVTVSFYSDRVPVWGDFYAKDGKDTWLYNEGFVYPDSDPTDPASNGSVDDHLLVPDTYIPAPGALMLAGIGTGFFSWLRRRRTL